ncbi:uroporphyrinogen-III synthase [Rhodotorula toruloides]|uniref:Uroporphyrinogen-III synthase n=1 Tax=Rhodotorula toruloides TaxID=5286 RepID=A0A511KQA2_RHOTO|nr:uroporphyrinogen-III synthase [Rhodotorula toruloides]
MAAPAREAGGHHLVLVRTPQGPLEQDPYRLALASLNTASALTLRHLPVLSTSFSNKDELVDVVLRVQKDGREAYDGVIMTSARSVEAWSTAQTTLTSSPPSVNLPTPSIPFFVVGNPTRTNLARVPVPPPPDLVFGAEESGTGEKLASFILQHFTASSEVPTLPRRRRRLLYLTGDKNRDTVPRILEEGGVELETLQVYATTRAPGFEADLDRILSEVENGDGLVWMVLYSPSGSKECLAELRQRGLVHSASVHAPFLEDERIPVHAVADKPEPEALVLAVLDATAAEEERRYAQ